MKAPSLTARDLSPAVIYFFSQRNPKSGVPVEMPPGYELAVNKRTGLPYLKKSASHK